MKKNKFILVVGGLFLVWFFIYVGNSFIKKVDDKWEISINHKEENNSILKEIGEKIETVTLLVTDFIIQDCLYDVDKDGEMEIVRLRAKLNKEDLSGRDTEWQENTWLGWKWYKEEIYLDIVDYQEGVVISFPFNHRVKDGYFDDGYRVKGMEVISMSGIELLCIFLENMGNRTMPQIRLLCYQKEKQEWVDYFEAYAVALEYRVQFQDNYIAQIIVGDKVLGELELSRLSESENFLSFYYKEDGTIKQKQQIKEDWHMNGSGFSSLEILYKEEKIVGKKKIYVDGRGIGWIKGIYQMENGEIVCNYSIEEYE